MCEYQYMDELHARPRHRQAHISACAYMTIWVVFLHVQLRRADLHARVQPQARVPVNHEGTYASSTWGMIARANYAILAIAQLAEHLTVDICSNQMALARFRVAGCHALTRLGRGLGPGANSWCAASRTL